jgi:hypothetical protein
MKLALAGQQRAKTFIQSNARPLEQALYRFHLEQVGPDGVLSALTAYQNPDGGFGHGLEPDLTLPDSSAICTTRAIQTLADVGTPADHPLVAGGIRYLLATYDRTKRVWEIVPRTANNFPHAPWWQYDDVGQAARWGDYLVNPRAEIVGCLHQYATLVPASVLREVTDSLLDHLASHGDPKDRHEIACYLSLVETPSLPQDLRRRVVSAIESAVRRAVERDPAKWPKYCFKPAGYMAAVRSPASPFAQMLAREVETCLDYEIGRQQPDGSWHPTWSWGDDYPEAWQEAKLAWQGILTVQMLKMLGAFGRLDSGPLANEAIP